MISIRNNKRTILRFTVTALAVLLFCGVFCGAASAFSGNGEAGTPYVFSAAEWNALGPTPTSSLINGSIKITGDGTIYPKFNSSSPYFSPSGDVTIDFSEYRGTFAGEPAASGSYRGALFGNVQSSSEFTLIIKNLKMESVKVIPYSSSVNSWCGIIVGFVGGSSNSFLKFENCTLKNCTVDAGSAVGGLVGYAGSVSVNATDCKLQHCDVKSKNQEVGGLVGEANCANINATGCRIENCNVTSTAGNFGYVGGLVGYASNNANVNATDCQLLHCDITAREEDVGGLVGYASNNADVKATGCVVANCSVASTDDSNVGGLVGCAENTVHVFITSCKVENTLVYASTNGYANTGGLVGFAGATTNITTSNVTNCVIAAGDRHVGGLVGKISSSFSGAILSGNTVANCTVAGSSYVGGLFGTIPSSTFTCYSSNKVEYCAVNGSTNTNLVCGEPASPTNLDWDADITKNYIYNNTDGFKDNIEFKAMGGGSISPVSSSNYLTIFKVEATPTQSGRPTFNPVTSLGQHGTVDGYGVVVEVGPMYTVTVDNTIENGSISCSPTEAHQGTLITVTATPNPGYHLNWTYWNKTGETAKTSFTNSFSMPDKNVIVGGDFKPNVTNVTFYNDTVLVDSKLNTYNESNYITDVTPISSKDGYIFAGWNVSEAAGTPLTDETYIKEGKWNYTAGADGGTLAVYANWTVLKTDVTAVGGIAKFGNNNYTVMKDTSIVVHVLLENVSNVTSTAVNFTADNTSIIGDIPDSYGNYGKDLTISIFDINATVLEEGTPAQFNVTVTFKDADTANAYKEKVKFFHYNSSGWDSEPLESTNVPNGDSVIYTVNTTSFSPFGMGIYTPKQQPPSHSSSGSSSHGTSVWLQPTAEPTAVPTQTAEPTAAVPTASPVKPVQTSASPLPVAGVLAGLGAALVFGLRRK